jgi:hypothetical protein
MLREVDIWVFEGTKAGSKCKSLCAGLFVKYVQLNERSGRQGHLCEVEVGVL